jgi:O-Antigen ligase
MTTANGAVPYLGDYASPVTSYRTASDRVAVGALSLTFLLSFLQFCLERNDAVRLAPVLLLSVVAIFLLFSSGREKRRMLLTAAIRPSTILLIAAVCVPALVSSHYRPSAYPFQYGIVLIVTLFAIRIVLSAIGFEGLLLSFFYGTTFGVLILVGLTFSELLESIGAKRYGPLFYDPNRTGFFAVTAIPAQIWFATRKPGRKYVLLASVLCVLVIIFASSRGSTVALVIGIAAAAVLYLAKRIRNRSFTASRTRLACALALLCLVPIVAAAEMSRLDDIGRYLSKKLAVEDRERGMDSGFTGRTTNWAMVIAALPKTSWLLGNGYRTSEEDFNFSVDSGYLTALYEMGIVATAVIVAKFALAFYQLCVGYISAKSLSGATLLAVVFTLMAFFCNGLVHRVLFGSGDPASIFALFAFVSARQDVVEATFSTT